MVIATIPLICISSANEMLHHTIGILVHFNQTVPAILPTVNNTGSVSFGVFKDKEIVAKHIHLKNGFF